MTKKKIWNMIKAAAYLMGTVGGVLMAISYNVPVIASAVVILGIIAFPAFKASLDAMLERNCKIHRAR